MEKSLEKALDIYSVLAAGRTISKADKETADLYNDFYSDSEVYDLTTGLLDRLNLKLYEYSETLFVSAGTGNKVFGYTNDDLKKLLNLRLNRELFLVYFITYQILLEFYKTSDTYQVKEYIRVDELIDDITKALKKINNETTVYSEDELDDSSFRTVAILWDSLPPMISEDKDRTKASRGSRIGYVKLATNFLSSEKILTVLDDRIYPTDRFHAIAENYFEDNGSAIQDALKTLEVTEDAEH